MYHYKLQLLANDKVLSNMRNIMDMMAFGKCTFNWWLWWYLPQLRYGFNPLLRWQPFGKQGNSHISWKKEKKGKVKKNLEKIPLKISDKYVQFNIRSIQSFKNVKVAWQNLKRSESCEKRKPMHFASFTKPSLDGASSKYQKNVF